MITKELKEQILTVRDMGVTNMFDVKAVQYYAFHNDLYELVCYLEERKNQREYANFILTGECGA